MTIWICDDEVQVLESVQQVLVTGFGKAHKIECFRGLSEMLQKARSAPMEPVHILIADIRLQDENGIDAAALLQAVHKDLYTIFFTGYPDCYYEDIFEKVKPFGYLAKPIKTDKLCKYINQIEMRIQNTKPCLEIVYKESPMQIPYEDILYIENEKRLVHVHCVEKTYSVYAGVEKLLAQPENALLQCHKSFAVNLRYVRKMEKNAFTLTDGTLVPISRSFEKSVKEQYFLNRGTIFA